MDNLTNSINELRAFVQDGQVWVILDVDRVMINTTSWFQACRTSDLLIPKGRISEFLEINNYAYSKNPTMKKSTFRKRTLKLINKNISAESINVFRKSRMSTNEFSCGSYIDEKYLYYCGYYIGSRVHIYKEPFRYLDYLERLYGDKLHVLYLSSGYTPFIKGLIDKIYKRKRNKNRNYYVFGSGIIFSKGNGIETFNCYGAIKRKVAMAVLEEKGEILFAVDDDVNNYGLLELVSKNGGITLTIEHENGKKINRSWTEFINKNLSIKKIKNELMKDDKQVSTYNKIEIEEKFPLVFEKFTLINQIGIMWLHEEKHTKALENLIGKVNSISHKKRLKYIYTQFVFRKNGKIYLRGRYFYHWLPSYLLVDPRTNYEKWNDELHLCKEALQIIYKSKILENWKRLDKEEKLLILSIIDHYKNAVFTAMNTIHSASIANHRKVSDGLIYDLDKCSKVIANLYYGLVFDSLDKVVLNQAVNDINIVKISKVMRRSRYYQPGMRELDDPYIILLSVLSLLKQAESRGRGFDLIVDFPYGGVELGLAYQSVFKLLNKTKKAPDVIHCYYSYRKNVEKADSNTSEDSIEWFYSFVPRYYHKLLDSAIMNKKNILFYDNNATTFNTLIKASECLRKTRDVRVDIAVAAINYDNISRYLLGNKDAEPLNPSWRHLLKYQPVCEYVTAFNTWGTSKKSRILESLFKSESNILLINNRVNSKSSKLIFKTCRVHNLYDLLLTLRNGGNMIGIHAVYSDRVGYYENQKIHKPINKPNSDNPIVPISSYERDSIKAMQKYIPKDVGRVLILEEKMGMSTIQQVIDAYGLSPEGIFIQLQHRINNKYIEQIKKNITTRLIVAIGGNQNDFTDYFEMLNSILDPKTDFILLDFSKHQPDMISKARQTENHSFDKKVILKKFINVMNNNKVPILFADDVDVKTMKEYMQILKDSSVSLAGIDMQNNLEIPANEQKYCIVQDKDQTYQIRIRKSEDRFYEWRKFVKSNFFKEFNEKKENISYIT